MFLNMKTLNVSRAKAHFSGIARRVIKSRESVIVKTPAGYVQIVPFDVPKRSKGVGACGLW